MTEAGRIDMLKFHIREALGLLNCGLAYAARTQLQDALEDIGREEAADLGITHGRIGGELVLSIDMDGKFTLSEREVIPCSGETVI